MNHIVMTPAAFCQNSSFRKSVQPLCVKQLVTQISVEGFDRSVFPWTPGFNKQCPYADAIQSVSNTPCCNNDRMTLLARSSDEPDVVRFPQQESDDAEWTEATTRTTL